MFRKSKFNFLQPEIPVEIPDIQEIPSISTEVSNDVKIIQEIPKRIEKKEMENIANFDDLLAYKHSSTDLYYKLIQRFLAEDCEYEYAYLTPHEDIKVAFSTFLNNNLELFENININFTLHINDIPRVDSRFISKRVAYCRFCAKKQFKGCCDEYSLYKRTYLANMIGLKLNSKC